MMRLLALDTATDRCSAALWCDGRVLARSVHAPRRQAEILLPLFDELLAEAGIVGEQLDAIACGRGPGAFTGVRLAVSVAQGVALALDRPVVPVSSLAALALAAPPEATNVLAIMDARMGEVYAGMFRRTPVLPVEPLCRESVGAAAHVSVDGPGPWFGVGSGWSVYAEALRQRCAGIALTGVDADAQPEAAAVATIGAASFARSGGQPAAELLPVYLRDKVALTRVERGQS